MLSNTKGNRIEKFISNYIVFDLETTGISPNYDEVIEISAVKVINNKIVGEFSKLVNPKRKIPHAASMVNGITDEMVADSPSFDKILPLFIEFIGDEVLVGHNINSFDMKFIYRDSEKYFGKVPDNDYIDTLSLARKCLPSLSHHRLTDLAEFYKLSTEGAHRALNDCVMNQKVYEHLGKEKEAAKVCPKCGQILKRRNGRFGEFYGCSGYPNCRYTEKI